MYASANLCAIFSLITSVSVVTSMGSDNMKGVTMTPEMLNIEAQKAPELGGGRAVELVDIALSSKNLELVRAAFRAPNLFGAFVQELEKMEHNSYRDNVVANIMEERWPFDVDAQRPSPPGSQPPPRLQELCIEVLSEKLPHEGLSKTDAESISRISTYGIRVRLAKQLRQVIAGGVVVQLSASPEPLHAIPLAPPSVRYSDSIMHDKNQGSQLQQPLSLQADVAPYVQSPALSLSSSKMLVIGMTILLVVLGGILFKVFRK